MCVLTFFYYLTRLLFSFLSVFQGSFFSFLPTSNLTKHSRGTLSRSSSDEGSSHHRRSLVSSSNSMYFNYRGLSSTPKKAFWFEYLYGRESAESDVTVTPKRNSPAVDNRANTPGFSDGESDWGI